MEFEFLPKLPSSNLDDRTFADLVDECMLRIPRYCPEWTDHNLSDPGITLIELFAWLTDQMLLRFNQVPRKNYVAFLELLGIRLQPPKPAQTDLTFYLASDLSEAYTIPEGIEVATVRTEQQPAIAFSTDQDLVIGTPRIKHLLTAETAEISPQRLSDPIVHHWNCPAYEEWNGPQQYLFNERPEVGNCFYLVFDAESCIEGNVLAISFKGVAGTPTGIDPNHPPRHWEAWDGKAWRSVLLQEADDATRGFSFHGLTQANRHQTCKADVILHLPKSWESTTFTTYHGRWLRCVLSEPSGEQPSYTHSPWITGLSARSIGGTVSASQCKVVINERLGISNGKPGQTFQLQGIPVLERNENEYILVEPLNGLAQRWQEVSDFASSKPHSRHYRIDSLTGSVQFGPLIREPNSLRYQTQARARIQQFNHRNLPDVENCDFTANATMDRESNGEDNAVRDRAEGLEHQYGAIPPVGAEIRMVRYRTGGGRQGNVQAHTLQFLQSAVPFVERVTNHQAARSGADAESLDQAVLRVPQFLRTRDRAVTVEDFEVLTQQAGAVARVRCLMPPESGSAGTVQLLVVPQVNVDENEGLNPSLLELTPRLRQQILNYLDERRLLGIQVRLAEPTYVGVSVQLQVGLEPVYNHPQAQQAILAQIRTGLYRFLNPITGGIDGEGWVFGRPLYPSDIVALLQKIPGIRFIGPIVLHAFHKQANGWERSPSLAASPTSFVDPGTLGLICSWADPQLRTGHVISLVNDQESFR